MSIILDGTSGITSPGGDTASVSVATPIIKSPSSLTLQTNGSTTAVTVDTAGLITLAPATSKIIGGTNAGRMVISNADQTTYAIAYGSTNATPSIFTVVTNTNNATTINANGNLVLNGGTATASGVGITFPATQSASSDANCLDDYEEGTWTPLVTFGGGSTGLTYASRGGVYTKVGNIVKVTCYVALSNIGSSSGQAQLSGLPFTAFGAYQSCTYWAGQTTFSGMLEAYVSPSTTGISLQQLTTGGVNSNLTNGNFANNAEIMVNATYQIA